MSRNKNRKISNGTEVRVGTGIAVHNIPQRYQGRIGFIAGTTRTPRGVQQFLVSFGVRRATPLPLSTRQFSVV